MGKQSSNQKPNTPAPLTRSDAWLKDRSLCHRLCLTQYLLRDYCHLDHDQQDLGGKSRNFSAALALGACLLLRQGKRNGTNNGKTRRKTMPDRTRRQDHPQQPPTTDTGTPTQRKTTDPGPGLLPLCFLGQTSSWVLPRMRCITSVQNSWLFFFFHKRDGGQTIPLHQWYLHLACFLGWRATQSTAPFKGGSSIGTRQCFDPFRDFTWSVLEERTVSDDCN